MKFYCLENDGMSIKPFLFSEIEAKDREEAYEIAEEGKSSNLGAIWVMTEEELNDLIEQIK